MAYTNFLNGLSKDSIANAAGDIMVATLPFITMGMIGHPALEIAAGSVGFVFLCIFIIRGIMLFKREVKKLPVLDNILKQLFFPYAFSLTFAIGIAFGEKDGWYGIWFCLFLAFAIILSSCLSAYRSKK